MASPRVWCAVVAAACLAPPAAAWRKVPHDGPLPVPTPQQLAYQGAISGLIHFGMATFFHDGDPGCTSSNWNACEAGGGCNSSDPASFAPTNLNVSAWVASFKALGATSAVLTAKHGCGFLAWQTATTLPDGRVYPYKASPSQRVLETFVDEMRAAGLGLGFYYSLVRLARARRAAPCGACAVAASSSSPPAARPPRPRRRRTTSSSTWRATTCAPRARCCPARRP